MEKKFAIYLDALPREYEVPLDDESNNGTMDQQSAQNAALSEAYAKGTVAGVPVDSGDPGYHDNSKYYKELAETAKNGAVTAKNDAVTAKNDAVTAKNAAEAARDTALGAKTYIDGAIEEMEAGMTSAIVPMTAEQLISSDGIENDAIYSFRKTNGGNEIPGNRKRLKSITGGTVAWNQLASNQGSMVNTYPSGTTATYDSTNKTWTIAGTMGSDGYAYLSLVFSRQTSGHKYLTSYKIVEATGVTNYWMKVGFESSTPASAKVGNIYYAISNAVYNEGTNKISLWGFSAPNGTAFSVTFKNRQIIDLTQMFGSAIADRAYALEQATAGSGIAWLKSYGFFTEDYYAYDAGSLQSVCVGAHKTMGFNLLDISAATDGKYINDSGALANSAYYNVSDYITVIAGQRYFFNSSIPLASTLVTGAMFDANKTFVGKVQKWNATDTFLVPTGVSFIRVNIIKSTSANACINISKTTGSPKNGDYVPYDAHSYPLDSSIEWHGIYKLVNNEIVADGDIYPPDGQGTRKYGIVDLGTRGFNMANSGIFYITTSSLGAKSGTNAISYYFQVISETNTSLAPDKSVQIRSDYIYFKDVAYTDAATFKTAMSGVYLVYELATPTAISASPYIEVQICDPDGTEQFVDYGIEHGDRDVAIPPLSKAFYMKDLQKKLDEVLPDSAEADGRYVIQQVQNKMALRPAYDLESFETEESSGAIATTHTGADNVPVKSLVAQIVPVQAGSGDPYPPGGGKNLYNKDDTSQLLTNVFISTNPESIKESTNGSVCVYISCQPNTTYTVSKIAGVVRFSLAYTKVIPAVDVSVYGIINGTTETALTITTGSDAAYLVAWVYRGGDPVTLEEMLASVQIELGAIATPYAPYSNIRPISGWTGAHIASTGENLLDRACAKESGYYDDDGVYHTSTAGTFFTVPFIPVEGDADYVVLLSSYSTVHQCYFYDENKVWISRSSGTLGGDSTSGYYKAFTTPSNCAYVRLQGSDVDSGWTNTAYQLMLAKGSTITFSDYQEFGGSFSVSWQSSAGTVYGGTLNVTTGLLTITNATVDLSTRTWEVNTGRWRSPGFTVAVAPPNNDTVAEISSEKYKTVAQAMVGNTINSIGLAAANNIFVNNGSTTVGDEPTGKMLYKLVSPRTVQLTPTEVKSFLGDNNIFADCGDVDVVFRLDPTMCRAEVKAEIAEANERALGAYPTEISSGAVASFSDGADNIPVRSLTAQIVPVQAGSGDPSPSNPRAISGWTDAHIHVAKSSIQLAATYQDVTGYYYLQTTRSSIRKDYYGTTSNDFVLTGGQVQSLISSSNLPAGNYKLLGTVSGSKSTGAIGAVFANPEGSQSVTATMGSAAVSVPAGWKLVTIRMTTSSWENGDWIQIDDFAIVVESSAVYPITFPAGAGTVYSGTLTDNGDDTWTLTVTSVSVDMGEVTWVKNGTYYYTQAVRGLVAVNEGICSVYAISNKPASQMPDAHFRVDTSSTSAGVVYVKDSRYESAADLKAGLSGQMMVLPLVVPATYTLYVSSVKTMLGTNNIFADVGDISELTYRIDPDMAADKKQDKIAAKKETEYFAIRDNELMAILLGTVAQKTEDEYDELRNQSIHNSLEISGSSYPRIDNTRLGLNAIKGRTVAFNQLVKRRTGSDTLYGITASAADTDGAITITGTATDANRFVYQNVEAMRGHKFLVLLNRKTLGQTNTGGIFLLGNYNQIANMTNRDYFFYANESYDWLRIGSGTTNGAVYDQKFIPQIFDLTQMYGSTIADSIYAMEQSTPGSGVAYVRARLPLDYYAYNTGTLKAPVVSGWSVTGKNLLTDTTWTTGYYIEADGTVTAIASGQYCDYLPVDALKDYMFTTDRKVVPPGTYRVHSYDSEKRWIEQTKTFTLAGSTYFSYPIDLPANAKYVRVSMPYSQYVNTSDYSFRQPPTTLSLPSTTLNGVVTAQDTLYIREDGENDYSLVKNTKTEIVDLGALTWAYDSGGGAMVANYTSGLPLRTGSSRNPCICEDYDTEVTPIDFYSTDKTACINNGRRTSQQTIQVRDSAYTDAAAFKAAMSGVMFAFEAATPTQTTIAEHLTLAEVSAIAENGGIISIVNANGDIVQPDLVVDTVLSRSVS